LLETGTTPSEYIGYGPYLHFSGLSFEDLQKDYPIFLSETISCINLELDSKMPSWKDILKKKEN